MRRNEKLINLRDAAALLPTRPHYNTLIRWARKGVNGRRLETWRVGNRVVTTEEAVARFVTPAYVNEPANVATPSHKAAEAALDELGCK